MIGIPENGPEFIGVKEIALPVEMGRDEYGESLYPNADHMHSLERAKTAAEDGFDEIISYESRRSFDHNIREAKQAVEILTGAFLALHGGPGTEDADFLAAIQDGLIIIHIYAELLVARWRGLENSLKT